MGYLLTISLLQPSLLQQFLDEPSAQVLLRVRYADMAASRRVGEHVMRTLDATKHPTILLKRLDQVGAFHVCIIHTNVRTVAQQ